jgi:nicotinate phosphoribosyltransferase
LDITHNAHLALLTDFYQLSMAYGYWKKGLAKREAAFHLFYRRPPFKGGFSIASGLEAVVHFIENFHISKSDADYLQSLTDASGKPYFSDEFLSFFRNLKLSVSIDAVPEGTAIFPYEPLLRIQGPLLECQLLESPLLNLMNFPTLIATKAARICLAAEGDQVMEFGLRRAQGIDGALTASRASFVGGCSSTSNVLAGKLYGIPVQGTQAHSWVMAFEEEGEAFQAYAELFPDSSVLLVDTYDTVEGVKKAIRVGNWLKQQGKTLRGVRLDSGDLAELSKITRKLLDEAGFYETKIIASNELDETVIAELKHQGAKISVWGVGTNLVTGKEQPALDGVYKLSALKDESGKWRYTLKLSEQMTKISNPGLLQVRRYIHDGNYMADVMYDIEEGITEECVAVDPFDTTKEIRCDAELAYQDLLLPIFREGKLVYALPQLLDIQARTKEELQHLPVGVKRFLNPHIYPVAMEKKLYDIKMQLIKKIRKTKYVYTP